MYAIIEDSGTQFRVSPGDRIEVDLRDGATAPGRIEFNRVLMIGEGTEARVGTPYVSGARVVGTLHGEVKDEKIIIQKFRRRKNYRRRTGHRQHLLSVTIESIEG